MTTPFSELAMRIAEEITKDWKHWYELLTTKEYIFVNNLFSYHLSDVLDWHSFSITEKNNVRILILLMAEQHWLEYENKL